MYGLNYLLRTVLPFIFLLMNNGTANDSLTLDEIDLKQIFVYPNAILNRVPNSSNDTDYSGRNVIELFGKPSSKIDSIEILKIDGKSIGLKLIEIETAKSAIDLALMSCACVCDQLQIKIGTTMFKSYSCEASDTLFNESKYAIVMNEVTKYRICKELKSKIKFKSLRVNGVQCE